MRLVANGELKMDQGKHQREQLKHVSARRLLCRESNCMPRQFCVQLKLISVLILMLVCVIGEGQQVQAQTTTDGKLHVRDLVRVNINLKSLWSSTDWANEEHTPGGVVDYTGESLRFRVVKSSSGKSHMWLSQWMQQPLNIVDDYPIFVMRYRTTGYDTKSKHQTVSVNDGMAPGARQHLRPMMCKQVISDGKIHEFRQDVRGIRKGRPAGPLVQIALAVRCDDTGFAEFEVFEMGFERDPHAGFSRVVTAYEREQPLALMVEDSEHRPLVGAKASYNHMLVGFDVSALSDAQGNVSLSPWQTLSHVYGLTVEHAGYVTRQVLDVKPGVPFTVELEPAVKISGQVLDGNDLPVSGAAVEFIKSAEGADDNSQPRGKHVVPAKGELWPMPVMTDGNGRWSQTGFCKAWKQVGVEGVASEICSALCG